MKAMPLLPTIFPVTCHTDFVGPQSTFVAIKGFTKQGTDYINKALSQGATTIVVSDDTLLDQTTLTRIHDAGATLTYVENTRHALATLSAQAADYPAKKLFLIGITGTKGKTTTAWLTYDILRTAGYKVALMSSVSNKINDIIFDAPLTTAQPDYLHQFLKLCVEHKVTHVVMEVAAQAVTLHRIEGLQFDRIIFTNFSHEHLEFYTDLSHYFAAKKQLFLHAKETTLSILNSDDTWVAPCAPQVPHAFLYGFSPDGDLILNVRDELEGLYFDIQYKSKRSVFHIPSLIGTYNIYNAGAALSIAFSLGIEALDCAVAFEEFKGVPGRLETYPLANEAVAVIDYAHTPDSYHAILSTLRDKTAQLIVIFGAAGKRDKSKRSIMGNVASLYADTIILTSDNPRDEDPLSIIDDIKSGIDEKYTEKIMIETDRQKAILLAYSLSARGTIIAILGKGNDEYQIVGSIKNHFSERDIINKYMV